MIAANVLRMEAEALLASVENLGEDFDEIVSQIYTLQGNLILTGVGKSAIIAQKVVATLISTGTPAFFMHASDALHGDLGMLKAGDMIICISNSGNTAELLAMLPMLKELKIKIIDITGQKNSELAKAADYVVNSHVLLEACSLNLAPTCSTTVQMALGDAIAIALLEKRSFDAQDFARIHPSGMLGKKLWLKSGEMAARHQRPLVALQDPIKKIISVITTGRLGATAVIDQHNHICGIITDGDIRRMLENYENLAGITAQDIYSPYPKIIEANSMAQEAMDMLKKYNIGQLIVLDQEKYLGMIHIHDLLKEGFD